MTKNERKGAMYAEPVECTSPTGQNFNGNVVIIANIYIGTIWGKLLQKNLLNFKGCLGCSKTVFIKTTYFEDDLVNYFLKIKVSKHVKRSNTLIKRTLQNFLVTTRPLLSAEKFYTKTNMTILY